MSYDDDPDLWQTDTRQADAGGAAAGRIKSASATAASKSGDAAKFSLAQAVREQVPLKRAILEQRRIDLQAITDLLSRAANDLRASERRAVEAEERAKLAEARAADAEARERKVNAQAVRAFETMKERIAQSEARAAAAEANAVARPASDNGKCAEARSFALEARLQAAEMRIAAARRALAENVVADIPTPEPRDPRHAAQVVPQPALIPIDADIVDTHVRH